MIDLIGKYNLTLGKIAKLAGLAFLGLFVLLLIFAVLSSLNSARSRGFSVAGSAPMPMINSSFSREEIADFVGGYAQSYGETAKLSSRNIVPGSSYTSGIDAEAYEVSDYSAQIETTSLASTCGQVAALKTRSDVIFESANNSDTYCSYRFKVAHAQVSSMLEFLKGLNPKELTENTYTIKNQIEDYTSQTQILQSKLAAIDRTLSNGLAAYDDITDLAVETQNADALAKIIDSKVQMIERLTQQRINTAAQLEQLSRAKAMELDRVDYTYFSISIYENLYIDIEQLTDSWKANIKMFVLSVNHALQQATVGVIGFIVGILPYIIYLFIILIIAKFGWRAAKYIWLK